MIFNPIVSGGGKNLETVSGTVSLGGRTGTSTVCYFDGTEFCTVDVRAGGSVNILPIKNTIVATGTSFGTTSEGFETHGNNWGVALGDFSAAIKTTN